MGTGTGRGTLRVFPETFLLSLFGCQLYLLMNLRTAKAGSR